MVQSVHSKFRFCLIGTATVSGTQRSTPSSRVLLKKLLVSHLVQKFAAWNRKVHYLIHNSSLIIPTMSQANQFNIIQF